MQISTAYSSTALSLASQTFEAAFSTSARPSQAPASTDRVQVSDQALESSRKLGRNSASVSDDTLQLLGDVLSLVTGRDVAELQATPDGEDAAASQFVLARQEATLSAESVSLSVGGTIATKDGKELEISLDLQYDHASFAEQSTLFQSGPGGFSLRYAGTAAELTSTSFSFTMGTAGDSAPIGGKGSLHLNDEVSSIGKELKPLAKEFMKATGARGGWGEVNRFLRSAT